MREGKTGFTNPMRASMFIKRNKMRSFALVLLMACITVCFLGGMYTDSVMDTYEVVYDDYSDYAMMYPTSGSPTSYAEFNELIQEMDKYKTEHCNTIIGVTYTFYEFKTLMGFNNECEGFIFQTQEDFENFQEVTDTLPDDLELNDGEKVISRLLANNWGVEVGDVLEYEDNEWEKAGLFYQPMRVKAILDIPGMQLFGLGEQSETSAFLLLRDSASSDDKTVSDELDNAGIRVMQDYENARANTNSLTLKETKQQLGILDVVFGGIVILVAIVLAVTINSAFSAVYEKRKYEFSIYKAIGFKSSQILKKIISEVFLLNGVGLALGSILCFLTIIIANYYLYPKGMSFLNVSVLGIVGTLVCNMLVVIPVIFFCWRRTKKYDVTIY